MLVSCRGYLRASSNFNLSAWSFGFVTTRPQYNPVQLATASNQMRPIYESVQTSGEPRCAGVPCSAELPGYF
eukprot:2170810-Rhodomonas_salina.1